VTLHLIEFPGLVPFSDCGAAGVRHDKIVQLPFADGVRHDVPAVADPAVGVRLFYQPLEIWVGTHHVARDDSTVGAVGGGSGLDDFFRHDGELADAGADS